MYINLDGYLVTRDFCGQAFQVKNGEVVKMASHGQNFNYEPLNAFLKSKNFTGSSDNVPA